ncbi:MAG: radical SAM protein [Elusimicrobiales bacterium]|nr:radical SAM protein [Elusimicrobiales bacterium]
MDREKKPLKYRRPRSLGLNPGSEAAEKRKWVRLTRACNNRCVFCLDEEAQNGTYLPFPDIVRDLSAGIREGCKRAVLSGGDPTVHPDFLKIIRSAYLIGYRHIQAISNGRMFCYQSFLEKAVKAGLGEITFSIHAPYAELNDSLTGIKGSFVQSMAALKNALKIPGLIVNCDIVANALNIDVLAKHIEMLNSCGVNEFDILHIMPFGRAWSNWDLLYYDPFKKKQQLFDAFSIRKKTGVHIWTNRFPAGLFEGCEDLIQSPVKLSYEILGRKKEFDALSRGKEMPCASKRCSFCVLERFCRDFRELCGKKRLFALKMPPCIKKSSYKENVYVSSDMPIEDIAMFYIEKRHFIKSSRCEKCCRNAACSGVPELYAMEHGFSCMKPL